jgi:enamine deaminase RidA (YjgF/YER057c/UK114 family)
MARQVIRPTTVHPVKAYSHAVRNGNTIHIAGQVALDPQGNLVGKGDIAAQAEQVYTNLKAVVEAAGGTLANIAKITTYTTSLAYRPIIADVRARYLPVDPPASTFLVISSLADPGYLLEVEAVAVLD